jgi:hypothetical protein
MPKATGKKDWWAKVGNTALTDGRPRPLVLCCLNRAKLNGQRRWRTRRNESADVLDSVVRWCVVCGAAYFG